MTANYKLTFDILRRSLKGMHAWVLVLDTKSINVWCAAGKGTFGTDELVKRIQEAKLASVVEHKKIILPQLGAVGVNAAAVQKRQASGCPSVRYRRGTFPEYVRAGYKKTREMSTIRFSDDRPADPYAHGDQSGHEEVSLVCGSAVLVLFGLQPSGVLFRDAWSAGLPFLLMGLVAVLAGAFLTPVLLPFVPFRSFALKGWIMGMLLTADCRARLRTLSITATRS